MIYLWWILGALAAWCVFGYCWLRFFKITDEEKEYEECPYD